MVKQSRLLSKFYKELSTWIARGCPEEEAFDINYGLCDNLYNWLWEQSRIISSIDRYHLQLELKYQLKAEFGNANYPFNSDDAVLHAEEKNKYTNQARLDWIAEHTPSED